MFTRFSNLILSRNIIAKRAPIRYNTTAPQEPAKGPLPPPPKPTTSKLDVSKGKGPITWRSLSFILVGGAGLLVIYELSLPTAIFISNIVYLGFHVVR